MSNIKPEVVHIVTVAGRPRVKYSEEKLGRFWVKLEGFRMKIGKFGGKSIGIFGGN